MPGGADGVRINVLLSPHQNAFFAELAEVVATELAALGVDARIVGEPHTVTPEPADVFVLLPPHEWVAVEGDDWLRDPAVAGRTIGISAEQPGSSFFARNADVARRLAAAFDFSQRAVDAFRAVGIDAHHLPFGHTSRWDRYSEGGNTDGPDVLFMGNFKERRLDALGGMATTLGSHWTHLVLGDNTAPNTGSSRWFVAGDDKRSLLASSKVLLNIHQSDEPYFEWLRFTEAALCGAVVLTEPSTHSEPYVAGLHFATAPLGTMAEALDGLLSDHALRQHLRAEAYAAVRANPFSLHLRALVDVASGLTRLPVPRSLPARRRREPLPHRNALAAPPPLPTPRSSSGHGCAVELIVVGDMAVDAPDRTDAGAVSLTRVADRRAANAAMRASSADAVGLVTTACVITPLALATLQALIADGADVACAMTARHRDGAWTLRGLWQPTGTTLDPADLDQGWLVARPPTVDDHGTVTARPGHVRHAPTPVYVDLEREPHGVVVVMATFEPDEELLRRQVASIRDQTMTDLTCVVTDDASSPGHRASIRSVIGDDPRFIVLEHDDRVGFYANFERGLVAARALRPAFVALCDQDDVWHPDKLTRAVETLRRTGASLVCTDVVPVDRDLHPLAESFFTRRHPTTDSVLDLTMMNSAIGATSVFRADLLDVALPFPAQGFRSFHDHWLARCAQLHRGLAHDPRPSMQYVQHGGNVQGFGAARQHLAPLLAVMRSAPPTTPAPDHPDVALVTRRLAELHLLAERFGDTRRLRRATRLHRWWLRGSRPAMWSLVASFLIDQHLRRRPRHEGIEIAYLRAARAQRAQRAQPSMGR